MEIDDILEEDLLDIFDGITNPNIIVPKGGSKVDLEEDLFSKDQFDDIEMRDDLTITKKDDKQSNVMTLNSENIDTISSLLKELLNNKTIEITIKIK
jgi:hypothetical protein